MKKMMPLILICLLSLIGYAYGEEYLTWIGDVSFNVKLAVEDEDDSGKIKFISPPEVFNGTLRIYSGENGPTKCGGYYIEFWNENNNLIVGIREISLVET